MDLSCCLSSLTALAAAFLVPIKVDIAKPECNHPFVIYNVPDMEGPENTEHKGFLICIEMDPRFIWDDPEEDFYTARVLSSNEILVKMPAFDATFSKEHDRDSIQTDKNRAFITDNVFKAIDSSRNAFVEETVGTKKAPASNPDRLWARFTLQFPKGYELTAKKIYPEAGDDDVLPLKFLNIPMHHTKFKNGTAGSKYFAAWKVTRIDRDAAFVKKGKLGDKKSKKSANSDLLDEIDDGTGTQMDESEES